MTCIVGVRTKSGVVLAGDSVGSNRHTNTHRVDRKTFNLSPEIALGFTSSYRMGQILRWHVDLDPITGSMHRYTDVWEWVGKQFIPACRTAMDDHGFMQRKSDVEAGGTFLLAVRDRLFTVGDDFQVGESEAMFDACGSGEEVALGALYSSMHYLTTPPGAAVAKTLAMRAIEAAAYLTPYVGGAITYVSTEATA